jgi:starvation-inducible DNA-binding protein
MAPRIDHSASAKNLQEVLRDLLCLAVVGDHVRWVLADDDVTELVQWLADAAAQWRAWAEEVAKRLVVLGVAPDGRVRSLAKDISTNWVPDGWLNLDMAQQLVEDRLRRVSEWTLSRRSLEADSDTMHLLDALCSGLDTQVTSLSTTK